MKTNKISNLETSYNNHYNMPRKAQSFRGLGDGFVVPLMDGIDRGGLATSFIIQDVCGSCLPRTWTGLHRNEDVTGKLNYQEATEVALREFITGPSMFAIPMAILYGCKKYIGKALDVPAKHIEAFSNVLKSSNAITADNIKDTKAFKANFYKNVFKNILQTSTKGLEEAELSSTAEDFAQTLIKIENAKSKGIIKNIRNIAVQGSREDLIAGLADKFLTLTKKSEGDTTRNLHIASLAYDNEIIASANIKKTLGMITNYTDDVIQKAGKKLNQFDSKSVSDFISNFSSSRMGGRFFLNLGMASAVAAFCMVIPKMYIRNKKFPGTKDLVTENNSNQDLTTKNKNNAQQIQKSEKSKGNSNPAFCGALNNIGNKLTKKGPFQWFNNMIESDGYNMALASLASVCYGAVLIPRLVCARDKDEFKEILVRDVTSMAALLYGRKAIQNIVSKGCSKLSGIALAKLPHKDGEKLHKVIFNYLRPERGVSVLSSSELISKYTHIDKFKNGIVDFCDFVKKSGGDIKKLFNSDEKLAKAAKEAFEKSGIGGDFESATSEKIATAFEKLQLENKSALNGIYEFFADTKNSVVKKARVMNSSFDFLATFILVPGLLGFGLPKLTEHAIKSKYRNQDKCTNSQPEAPKATQNEIVKYSSNAAKTTPVFKEFV